MKEYIDSIRSLVPTEVIYGEHCIKNNADKLLSLGEHALIVTGKSSAVNGSLRDVLSVLEEGGKGYTVFDRVTPNPTIACVREAVALLKEVGADFIVAIGGGSPMDAAKAIATFAVQDRKDEEVFSGGYENKALPMAHVPTTAGTGSEVTPYAILTNDFQKTKTSITSEAMFPKVAFLDARYMFCLGRNTTVNTAIDALSHAVEGMFTKKSSPETDKIALQAIEMIFSEFDNLKNYTLSERDREKLLVASMLAGVVIAHTGTTVVHAMGYPLTYFHDIDHGRANGLLLGEMLLLCAERQSEKTDEILRAASLFDVHDFSLALSALLGEKEDISREELEEYAVEVAKSKKLPNITYTPDYEDIRKMYLESFNVKQ